MKVKCRIRIKLNIQELWRLKIKLSRVVDAHNGGVEARNGAVEGL
jgi:hypothetical protein